MKEVALLGASLLVSVSLFISANMIAESNWAPDVDYTNATKLTISIMEKSVLDNNLTPEETTDRYIAIYEKVLGKMAEIEK